MGKEIILRATKEDYKRQCENLKKKLAAAQDTIENYDSLQRAKCCDCCEGAIQDYVDIKGQIMCFEDDYFKGLSFETIAQLAKKSIRLTDDNNRLRHKLEDIEEITDDKKILEIIERTD